MLDPQFSRPAPESVRLTVGSPWGPRGDHVHHGIDLGMPEGTPLLALADGVVIRVQPDVVDEAGRWVGVRYPNGMVSRHLHMVRVGDVAVGQAVRRGQVIGYAGNTGRSSGPHLHLALHAPAELLPAIEAEVGKPTGGWGPSSKYGVAIPAEPWVPVDGYRLTTLAKLAAQGIPTYVSRARWTPTQTKGAIVIGALGLALVGVGLAVRYRRRKDAGLGDARSPFDDVELETLDNREGRVLIDQGELPSIVERTIDAGAKPPLKFIGAGATGAVFCDSRGKGYKTARYSGVVDTLREEAEWLKKANAIPFAREHVARFDRWHPKQGVIERECVTGKRAGWSDSRKVGELHQEIERGMLPYGWGAPERKEDSYIKTRDRGLVLVDASMPRRVGRNLIEYTLDVIEGRRPRGKYESNEDLAFHIRAEIGNGTIPKDVGNRILKRLGSRELAGFAGPDDWWQAHRARLPDKLCYATKQDALNVFRDENRETIENWGGLDAKARPSDFDAINHKYGVKADTLSKALWAAMPARRPFCLENIDVEALNDTAPGRAGNGFRLPSWVHERGYEAAQMEHYQTRAELEDEPAAPVRYRRVDATKIGTDGRRRSYANLKAFDRDCGKRARRADIGCTLTNLRRLRDGSGLATVKIHGHRPVTPGTWRLHLDSFEGLRAYLEMRAADATGGKRQRWGAEDVRVADDVVPF